MNLTIKFKKGRDLALPEAGVEFSHALAQPSPAPEASSHRPEKVVM